MYNPDRRVTYRWPARKLVDRRSRVRRLGSPSSEPRLLVAAAIATSATFASAFGAVIVTAGDSHTCSLLDDGSVKCWGDNSIGALGLGDTSARGDAPNEMGDNLPEVDLGTGRTAKYVTAGHYSQTCAILDDDSVKCWGTSGNGQLGLGGTSDRGGDPNEMGDNLPTVNLGTGHTAKSVTVGSYHTCALLDNDSVKCWGWNPFGQLGLGDTSDRGGDPNEMGDNLPAVNLGTGHTAKSVTAGGVHTCAILDDDSVRCWGLNDIGQLGLDDTYNRRNAAGGMSANLPEVDLGTGHTAKSVTAGSSHTCALLNDDSVKCWGLNNNGQLGLGDTSNRGAHPGDMGDGLYKVDLGTGRTAKSVTAGGVHTCALLDDGSVKCWGLNDRGQLGLGNTSARGDAPNEMGDNLPEVDLGTGRTAKYVTAGSYHTCAILDDDSVKCWGDNDGGRLGLGDTSNRGDAAGEMGDNLPALDLGAIDCTASQTASDDGTDGNFYCVNGGTVGGRAGACTCTGCTAGYSGASCQDYTTLADEVATPPPPHSVNTNPAFPPPPPPNSPKNLVLDDDSHATSRVGASAMLTMLALCYLL